MTFISRKSRIFVSRWLDEFDAEYTLRAVRKRSDARLKRFISCDDLRAWTNNFCLNHDHLVDLMSDGEFVGDSRVRLYGRYIPVPVLVKLLQNTKNQNEKNKQKKSKSEVNVNHLSQEAINDKNQHSYPAEFTQVISKRSFDEENESENLMGNYDNIGKRNIDGFIGKAYDEDEEINKIQQEKFILEKNLLNCTSLLGRALDKLEKINVTASYGEDEPKKNRSAESGQQFQREPAPKSISAVNKYEDSIKYSELLRKISGLREKLMKIQECQQQVREKIQCSQQKMERCVSSDQVTELYNWQEQAREKVLEKKLEKLISARGKILSEMYQALTLLNRLKRNSRNAFGVTDYSYRSLENDLNEIQVLKQSISCFCGCQCSGLESSDTEKVPCMYSSPSDRSYTFTRSNTRWDNNNYANYYPTNYNSTTQKNAGSDIEESCRSTDVSSSSGPNYNYRSPQPTGETYSDRTTYYDFSNSTLPKNQIGSMVEQNEVNERIARGNISPQRDPYMEYDRNETFERALEDGVNTTPQRNEFDNYIRDDNIEGTPRGISNMSPLRGISHMSPSRDISNTSSPRGISHMSPSRDISNTSSPRGISHMSPPRDVYVVCSGNDSYEEYQRSGMNTTPQRDKIFNESIARQGGIVSPQRDPCMEYDRNDDFERAARNGINTTPQREAYESYTRNGINTTPQRDAYESYTRNNIGSPPQRDTYEGYTRSDSVEGTNNGRRKVSINNEYQTDESIERSQTNTIAQKDTYEGSRKRSIAERNTKHTSSKKNQHKENKKKSEFNTSENSKTRQESRKDEQKKQNDENCREICRKKLQFICPESKGQRKASFHSLSNYSTNFNSEQEIGRKYSVDNPNARPKTSPTTKAERKERSKNLESSNLSKGIQDRRAKSETTMKEIEKTLRNYEQRLNKLDFVEYKVEGMRQKLLEANNLKKQLIKDKANLQSKVASKESNSSREMKKLCLENKELKRKVECLAAKFETQYRKVQNLKCTAERARELECEAQELKKELSQYKNSFEHQRKCIRKWENVVAAQRTEIENLMNHISQLMAAREPAHTNRAIEKKYVQRTRSYSPYSMKGQAVICPKAPTNLAKLQSDDDEPCWCEQYNWQQKNYNKNRGNCEAVYYRKPQSRMQWCIN